MIPRMNIIAWATHAPWPELRQIEQDLIISRALVAIFSHPFLARELRFRGGTALNKLHFPKPLRYSEDIDLVRTSAGGIGPILDALRDVLEPWLGRGQFDQSDVAPKLRFRVPAEEGGGDIRLKLEINTREIDAYDPPQTMGFAVTNPWFTGDAQIATFTREELLATKLRALLQRDKGRDLLDLAHALAVFPELNRARIAECFGLYLGKGGLAISRAMAEQRMFAKLAAPSFITDIRPLLSPEAADDLTDAAVRQAFTSVFNDLVALIPGDPWAKRSEMAERFNVEIER
jgi:predicted nucleotidyltransferase component of viral defense system